VELVRIGEKIINREHLLELIDKILLLRSNGATQQDVANTLNIERPFISNLESLGEVRVGKKVALVGFPVGNKEEVEEVAKSCGIDFIYILNQKERMGFVKQRSKFEMFNEILELLAHLREYDLVVFMGSDKRSSMIEKVLSTRVYAIPIGPSPLKEDQYIDPNELRETLGYLVVKEEGDEKVEKRRRRKSWIFKKRPQSKSKTAK
jgi:hypothetical protein